MKHINSTNTFSNISVTINTKLTFLACGSSVSDVFWCEMYQTLSKYENDYRMDYV